MKFPWIGIPIVIIAAFIMLIILPFHLVKKANISDISIVPITKVVTDLYSGVLIVYSDGGQGSCFVVDERDGWYYAITAAHVVETPIRYDQPDFGPILTVDKELYEAEIVKVDDEEDVAIIRFESPEDYQIYSFGRAIAGESCTTIGWSDGSRLIYKGNVVSADLHGFVAANGGVVPGCSGGVLFNSNNEILGVTVQVSVYRGWAWDNTILYVPAKFAEALLVAAGE